MFLSSLVDAVAALLARRTGVPLVFQLASVLAVALAFPLMALIFFAYPLWHHWICRRRPQCSCTLLAVVRELRGWSRDLVGATPAQGGGR